VPLRSAGRRRGQRAGLAGRSASGAIDAARQNQRLDCRADTYFDWLIDHAFLLLPAQHYWGRFLMTFKDYPQRQKATTFNLDEVMEKLQDNNRSK
jgi:hypothetical protein